MMLTFPDMSTWFLPPREFCGFCGNSDIAVIATRIWRLTPWAVCLLCAWPVQWFLITWHSSKTPDSVTLPCFLQMTGILSPLLLPPAQFITLELPAPWSYNSNFPLRISLSSSHKAEGATLLVPMAPCTDSVYHSITWTLKLFVHFCIGQIVKQSSFQLVQ